MNSRSVSLFDVPEPTIKEPVGITASQVSAGSSRMPQSEFEFMARGGVGNTVQQHLADAEKKEYHDEVKLRMQKLLDMQEEGADLIYKDAIEKYPGIEAYIPKKELFYNPQDGSFEALKYAQAVYVGINKFREQELSQKKNEADSELANRKLQFEQDKNNFAVASRMRAGQIMRGAGSTKDAYAQALESGIDSKEFGEAFKSLDPKTPKEDKPDYLEDLDRERKYRQDVIKTIAASRTNVDDLKAAQKSLKAGMSDPGYINAMTKYGSVEDVTAQLVSAENDLKQLNKDLSLANDRVRNTEQLQRTSQESVAYRTRLAQDNEDNIQVFNEFNQNLMPNHDAISRLVAGRGGINLKNNDIMQMLGINESSVSPELKKIMTPGLFLYAEYSDDPSPFFKKGSVTKINLNNEDVKIALGSGKYTVEDLIDYFSRKSADE